MHVQSVPVTAEPWRLLDTARAAVAGPLYECRPAHGLGGPGAGAAGRTGESRGGRVAGVGRGGGSVLVGGGAGAVARLPPGGGTFAASARRRPAAGAGA